MTSAATRPVVEVFTCDRLPARPAAVTGPRRAVVHTQCDCGAEMMAVVGITIPCPNQCGRRVKR